MNLSIRAKMILFIGLPATAIFVIAMLWIVSFAEKQARRVEEAEMGETTAAVAARFDEYIGRAARVAETTARFVQFVPNLEERQIFDMLRGTVEINRRIFGAAMAFEPGTFHEGDSLYCPYVYQGGESGTLVEMNIDQSVYDWYRDEQWQWWHLPKQLGQGAWTKPYFDEGAGNTLMITYAAPFDRNGEFGGVTTVDIDLKQLHADVADAITGIGEFYILGPQGQIIASPVTEEILSETIFEKLEKVGRRELVDQVRTILNGASGEVTLDSFFGDQPVMVAYAPIPSTGWTFVAYRPESEIFAEHLQRRNIVVGAFLAAAALMLVTIVFMSGRVSRPIRLLRGKVHRIAEGEPDVKVDDIQTGDEIEELASAFGDLREKISDREARLKTARETALTELLESAPDAMFVVDADGTICRINTKVEEMFGFARAELIGRSIDTLLPERFASNHGGHLHRYFEKPSARQMGSDLELFGRRSKGEEFPIEVGLSPFHEPQGVMAVAAIRDITERKRAEAELHAARTQAEAANHAKSDFLSSMSHELRTPLNGVLGYAQILQRDKEATPKQKSNVESIISCGDHLLSLINDVLDLSKIEAGRLDLDEGPCDLDKLIRSITDIVSQRAQSKKLDFRVEISPEVPRGIVTDGPKLRQVLVNLLGNAVKFTAAGSVTLRLAETSARQLKFEVIDTGVGMEAKELEEIFDPFKQVEAGKAAGGTGLGLAISRKLLEKMGGQIEVESEKGKGSCFRVVLPLVEIEAEELNSMDFEAGDDPSAARLAPGQKARILVTDDRETNRNILEQLLEDIGIEVVLADDGDTALERLRDSGTGTAIDLVLMDVRMPRMNGIEAVKQIRADEKLKAVPVIAVTASVFPEFRDKARAAGFDDFLPKPFRAAELIRQLRQYLDVEWENQRGTGDTGDGATQPVPTDTDTDSASAGVLDLSGEALEKFRAALKIKNLTALKHLAKELSESRASAVAGHEIARLAQAFDFAGLAALEQKLSAREAS